ncbi:MAG: hypothetical protein JW874_04695 [Spirochaetales bacterium]|nr:hypothetical protein [Spirochaetales bacterium]
MNQKAINVFPPDNTLDENTRPCVKLYDFRRPDRFSREQIRSVSILHDHFKRLATAKLCQTLRMYLDINPPQVDQLTFGEFLRSLPPNPAIGIIDMKPLESGAVLALDPALVQAFMNRILGGNGIPDQEESSRTISELEALLLSKIFGVLTETLNESWKFLLPLESGLKNIETDPKFVQPVSPHEMVILVSMGCSIGDIAGYINFCIPYITIESLLPKFSAAYFYSTLAKDKNPNAAAHIPELPLQTRVYYETDRYSLKEIRGILAGKEIELDPERDRIFSAGSVPLLRFRPQKDGSYTVTGNEALRHSFDRFLHPAATGTSARGDNAQSGLIAEIASLKGHLDKRFAEIEKRQDDLAGQFVFHESTDLPEKSGPGQSPRPFSSVKNSDVADLYTICAWENPQAVAVVLSYLDPNIAASLLEFFDNEKQARLVARVAQLDRMAPELLTEMEKFYSHKLRAMASHVMFRVGGLEAAVQILNMSSRSLEKNVIEHFEQSQPELAEKIKQNMFVFEDIVMLQKKDCRLVVEKADRRDLLLALKMTDEQVRKYIETCLPEKEKNELQQDLAALGRVRLTEIEAAQTRIVGTIRLLEENGEIIVARMNELVE